MITFSSHFIIKFGYSGNKLSDFKLANKCNIPNNPSHSIIGQAYKLPLGVKQHSASSYLGGENKFEILDFEVFKVFDMQ